MTATAATSTFHALCPLDGRYSSRVHKLRQYFTEEALMKARAQVEVEYINALACEPAIEEVPKLSPPHKTQLLRLILEFDDTDIARIKAIERKLNHDVKAVEQWLREKITAQGMPIPVAFVHFALTSEDPTNLGYGLLINQAIRESIRPQLDHVLSALTQKAFQFRMAILSMTHGQAAPTTTIGEQLGVYLARLERGILELRNFSMDGKFGGAVGNYSAHYAAYPDINWPQFGENFVKALGLNPLRHTTQINPHDDLGQLSHLMMEVDTILLDLCVDMWLYISRGVFCERVDDNEVSSSTMPNKVNPIDWENAEGNLGIANALFAHFADKLPRSRLQRDLSDSTVQRWLGCAFGAQMVAVQSILRGLEKIEINQDRARQEIAAHPEIHSEAIQIVMRRYGYEDAYEQLKELTRGKVVTTELLCGFIQRLQNVPESAKGHLYDRIYQP